MDGEYLWPANYGTDHHRGHWQSYSIKGSQISATIFDGFVGCMTVKAVIPRYSNWPSEGETSRAGGGNLLNGKDVLDV